MSPRGRCWFRTATPRMIVRPRTKDRARAVLVSWTRAVVSVRPVATGVVVGNGRFVSVTRPVVTVCGALIARPRAVLVSIARVVCTPIDLNTVAARAVLVSLTRPVATVWPMNTAAARAALVSAARVVGTVRGRVTTNALFVSVNSPRCYGLPGRGGGIVNEQKRPLVDGGPAAAADSRALARHVEQRKQKPTRRQIV